METSPIWPPDSPPSAISALAPHALHEFCHGAGGDHRDDFDAGGKPILNILRGVARAGGDDCNPLFQHNLGDLIHEGTQQHDVDAEGLVRQSFGGTDLRAHIIAVGIAGGDDPEATAVGDRRGQFAVGDPGHAPLKDGVGDADQITDWSV